MNKKIITTAIAAVLISVSSIAPAFAQSGRQKDKNNMRTLLGHWLGCRRRLQGAEG